MLRKNVWNGCMAVIACCLMLVLGGCNQQQATDSLKKAEESAEAAGKALSKEAGDLAKKGEALADQLGAEATAFLNPLKEQFAGLEKLKGSPSELSAAVSKAIESIEQKAENLKLPEPIEKGIGVIKEKLVALRDYLAGEVEPAKVEEHLKAILDSVKSGLGVQ